MFNQKDAHFKIHCHSCEETFNVFFKNIKNKVCLVCPNCGLEFNPEALVCLKNAVKEFEKAFEKLFISEKECLRFNSFSFSIELDSFYERPYQGSFESITFDKE